MNNLGHPSGRPCRLRTNLTPMQADWYSQRKGVDKQILRTLDFPAKLYDGEDNPFERYNSSSDDYYDAFFANRERSRVSTVIVYGTLSPLPYFCIAWLQIKGNFITYFPLFQNICRVQISKSRRLRSTSARSTWRSFLAMRIPSKYADEIWNKPA